MGITAALLANLIKDKELIISPYDPACLKGNEYELHNNGFLSWYEDQYGTSTTMDSEDPDKLTEIKITNKGRYLEPGRLYYMTLEETISCPNYATEISTHKDMAKYGMTLTIENPPAYESGVKVLISIKVQTPLLIYPKQKIATLSIDSGDAGTSAIPIGGIIGWRGGPLPYGFCLCDGSHGSPNLMGKIIMGDHMVGNGIVDASVHATNVVNYTPLIFIMRYL